MIAFRSGSVTEVVDDDITGFVVEDESEAIGGVGELDRRLVRGRFEQWFSATRMAKEYLAHYEALAGMRHATSFPGLRARELERDSMPVPAPPSP